MQIQTNPACSRAGAFVTGILVFPFARLRTDHVPPHDPVANVYERSHTPQANLAWGRTA
jgi:hypothetical protein